MKYKIGVFGSAADNPEKAIQMAKMIGSMLAEKNCILITGATTGLPGIAQRAAHKAGGAVWGFSPAINQKQHHERTSGDDLSVYTNLIFIPSDYQFAGDVQVCRKYRNVTSTATCDAGIIISGRWGTMNEFTNLYDMGKVIGVFTGTGGTADELPELMKKISKKSKAVVIFDSSPDHVLEKIISELDKRRNK